MPAPLVTFSRAIEAGYYNKEGVWTIADVDEPRYAYDPENGNYLGLQIFKTNDFAENVIFDTENKWFNILQSTFYGVIWHSGSNAGYKAQIFGMADNIGFVMRSEDEKIYVDFGDGNLLYAPGKLKRNSKNTLASTFNPERRIISLNGEASEDDNTAEFVTFGEGLLPPLYMNNGIIQSKYFSRTFTIDEMNKLTEQ